MKISQMNNDQAADALVRIAEPVGNICDDEDFVAMLDEVSKMRDIGVIMAVGKMLPRFVGYALKKHRHDLYEIIGALDGKPADSVGKMNFAQTVQMVQDSYDDILKGFFTRSAAAEKMSEKS